MDAARLRHLPVVSRKNPGHVEGLVTHRDVLRVAGRAFVEREESRRRMLQQLAVGEIMRRKLHTARPGEPAAAAARRMLDKKIGCLPVVDDDGTLVGIVTEADFVEFAARYLEGEPHAR
jgi:CBS domain-containing protein